MSFSCREIPKVEGLTRKEFERDYLRKRKPVILKDFSTGWAARDKWTPEYFKKIAGDTIVPLYDNSKVDYSKKVNEPIAKMPFREYLDLIAKEPTQLRIFLFNIFTHVPELCNDFDKPELAPNVLSKFPMMFFGGEDSEVFIHFDLDLSNVFLTQFHGNKSVLLFDPKYSQNLYKIPFAVHNVEDIDMENPDFEKWPGLKGVTGDRGVLEHGETLFIPSGWWHYMKYLDGSYSLALRSLDPSPLRKLHGLYNVTLMRQFDNLARKIGGQNWIDYKDRLAILRGNRA